MEFFEVVEKRRSVRTFSDRVMDNKTLNAILETADLAPSAGNLQAYRIVVVRNQELKQKLATASHDQNFIVDASVVLVFLADKNASKGKYGQRGVELYSVQDATIAAAYSQLAATALGLGSVWVGAFESQVIAKLVDAKPHEEPIAIIPIGYPTDMPKERKRKNLDEIATNM